MPIKIKTELESLTQQEFGVIAYKVMNIAFTIHKELGPLFDEVVYKNALFNNISNAIKEVEISVSFDDFQKSYFMDMLVAKGAVFEFKTVNTVNSRHRSQLLNYLLLTNLNHGKIINFGVNKVEHEFVNSTLTSNQRRKFVIDDHRWTATDGFGKDQKDVLIDVINDWGTGLDCNLYKEALFHFLGGADKLYTCKDVYQENMYVAQQKLPICGDSTGLFLTTFQELPMNYQHGMERLLNATHLRSIQWINIARHEVAFVTSEP